MAEQIGESRHFKELDAQNAPVKNIDWEAAQLETDAVPIIDPGIGKEKLLRSFFFKAAPVPKGTPRPTKLELISHYKRLIADFLWKDGLSPIEHETVQLYTKAEANKFKSLRAKMYEEKADFVIMVLAEARHGQSITDKIHKAT